MTSLVTILPLLYLTLVQVLQDNLALARQSPDLWANLGPLPGVPLLLVTWGTLSLFRRVAAYGLQFCIETFGTAMFSRFGMHVILSFVFTGWAWKKNQSWVLALALLSLSNIHLPAVWNEGRLRGVLEMEGYALVARQESVTGYVSVLDNVKDGFRIMRCDHSLLGGEWRKQVSGSTLKEPVYGIFVMLEAVRLVETESMNNTPRKGDNDKKALVMYGSYRLVNLHQADQDLRSGLGVGTSPTALIAHGISTTSIEIDPIVHAYATKYFNLPDHKSIIGDAITTVKDLRNGTYDYIIHDVFTGGVEPLNLFTEDFLDNLKGLLTEDGTIAINYAGDLLLPTAASVVSTILAVFPTCRIYRESAPVGPGTTEDFTNMVLFCRKSATESFTFRKPTSADFLGTGARKEFLLPQHEIGADTFGINVGEINDTRMITKRTMKTLARSQERSRLGHWHVMRGVLPDAVWENW